jgi:hypothetical protein
MVITQDELLDFFIWLEQQKDIDPTKQTLFRLIAIMQSLPEQENIQNMVYNAIKDKEYEKLKKI